MRRIMENLATLTTDLAGSVDRISRIVGETPSTGRSRGAPPPGPKPQSLPDAALAVLKASTKALTAREVYDALLQRGQAPQSAQPMQETRTALKRLSNSESPRARAFVQSVRGQERVFYEALGREGVPEGPPGRPLVRSRA
jgi:hypothetical protein